MAEAVVGSLAKAALGGFLKLSKEVLLVANFRKDFISLDEQLKDARGFLQDADQQSRQREEVKQWLENFRVITLSAEDIFEEYAEASMYGNDAQSCGLNCTRWVIRYNVAVKIKDIREHIRSVIENANQLHLRPEDLSADEALPSTSQSLTVNRKRFSLLSGDSRLVEVQCKVDDMLRLLENPAFIVIVVVGMEGIGKTYLLQHVFNQTKERYDKSIWLSVSKSYSISKLQCVIASHLGLDITGSEVTEQRAAELIHEKMKGTRCLVVLDDVLATREEDLLSRLGLPTAYDSPCIIVVSTRRKDVCRNLDAIVYEMQPLSDDESWSLFSFYAFREYEGNRVPHQQLEEVGREIVKQCGKQCGNLPLAIKTIAASLANTTISWELKLRQLKGVATANVDGDPIMSVLRFSYHSLPARLKACFAYLSFFPEDEEIECEYLINMWIGEGFIPGGEGQWDVAWDCLYQLANLCLLQVWEEVKNGYLTKYCKIHGLLYDLAIDISRENKCAFSVEEASTYTNGSTGCRRILLAKKDIDDNAISEIRSVSRSLLINAILEIRADFLRRVRFSLRTLSLSKNEKITSIPGNLFSGKRGLHVRRLHVLDLSSTSISTLPASVGKMKILQVLNLRRTKIREVPECVRHLKSLMFLAFPGSCTSLPVWISELKCLRHLECEGVNGMPKGLSKLASLRTLRSWFHLSIEEDKFMRLDDLVDVTQLQELWLKVNHDIEFQRILAKLVNMRRLSIENQHREVAHFPENLNQLRHLAIKKRNREVAHISENMKAMEFLESLRLNRFVVPSWICELANLRELILNWCECIDYPELQRMRNLVRLVLWGNERCRELPKAFGKSGGFPRLRFLKIGEFDELEEFPELEEGAMACLEEFNLVRCPKVKKVGGRLELLKRLKEFNYSFSATNELREKLKNGGEYWIKIKATNPRVTIIKQRK